jgi:hypothetical protein
MKNVEKLKCPCCLSDLVVTHQDRYETLLEHVEDREPSLKDGYQCLNSSCAAHEYNGVWIEEGDLWIKEPPAGMNYREAEIQIEKHSFSGRTTAVNSFADGYERFREEQKNNTLTLNLRWFILEFIPRFERSENSYEWKRTGQWKRTIMRSVGSGRYVHFMTFWDIYYYQLDNYRRYYAGVLEGDGEASADILRMIENQDMWGKKEKRFWWSLAHYFICWVWNRGKTKKILKQYNEKVDRKLQTL